MRGAMDALGIEPRVLRMRSGCDTTTPRAPDVIRGDCLYLKATRRYCFVKSAAQVWRAARTHCVLGKTSGRRAPNPVFYNVFVEDVTGRRKLKS